MSQYPWLLLVVYVVTVGVVQLLALWAATSTRPWLLRAMAVWTPIALLMTLRAYEPAMLLFAGAAETIAIGVVSARFWPPSGCDQPRSSLARFRLADLLVLTLFVATWLALASRFGAGLYRFTLPIYVGIAALPLTALTILAQRLVVSSRKVTIGFSLLVIVWLSAVLMRLVNARLSLGVGQPSLGPNWPPEEAYRAAAHGALPLAALVCIGVPILAVRMLPHVQHEPLLRRAFIAGCSVAICVALLAAWLTWDGFWWWTGDRYWQHFLEIANHSVFFVALGAFIALVTWLSSVAWNDQTQRLQAAARAALIVLGLIAGTALLWLYCQMLWYAPFPKVNVGPVNGYERLIGIAKDMNAYYNSGPLSKAAAAELDKAALLLREHNQVPQHVIESRWKPETGLTGHDMMALTGRFWEAAEDAAKRGEIDRAADYGVAIIRFDAMAGQGEQGQFANLGHRFLTEHRREFSPAKARDVIGLLRQTLAERHEVDFLVACRRAQWERMTGWYQKLQSTLARLAGKAGFDLSAEAGRIREARKPWEMLNRLLQTDLAIRAFRSERGRLPQSLGELTPEYLQELPIDPFSDLAIVYRPSETEFVLYSVGPDGVDNGGQFLKRPVRPGETNYDLRLEP